MADKNNTAVIDDIKPINKVTFKQRMISYKRKPLSLVMLLLVALAAVLSAAALVFIIVYVLVRGIPNLTPELFALTYDSSGKIVTFQCVYSGYFMQLEGSTMVAEKVSDSTKFNDWPRTRKPGAEDW